MQPQISHEPTRTERVHNLRPIPPEFLRRQRASVERQGEAFAVVLTRHFIDLRGDDDVDEDVISLHADEASAIRAASWAEAR